MIRFRNWYFSPEAGGGTATADAGTTNSTDGGAGGESWHSDYAYFQNNPEARKAFADFKGPDDVFKSYSELRKVQSQPFRLPKDGAKLTDEQRAELRAGYAKLSGVPETPEGYEFETPEDVPLHEPSMAKFRALLHERGVDPQTAKDLLGLQVGMVRDLNKLRAQQIQGMTDNNYKTFLNEDCGGDKEQAARDLELTKRYLQTMFTKDGEIDTEGWEKFYSRIAVGDRIIELPLLRALLPAARMAVGTGGAPGGSGNPTLSGGNLYAEMKGNRK